MAKRTRRLFRDVLLISAMFTDGAHPQSVVKERLAGHDACWEFRLTIRARRRPRKQMATQSSCASDDFVSNNMSEPEL